MKANRLLPIILILLISATSATALPQWIVTVFNLCDDTDKGPKIDTAPLPYIAIPAHAKTPKEKQFDECIDESGEPAPFGRRIKERLCGENRELLSKVYDCRANGFEGCVSTQKGAACASEPPGKKCGDNIVQPPEQCDPPGANCKDARGNDGKCSAICGCDVKPKPHCGNNNKDPGEDCDPPGSDCKTAAGQKSKCSNDCKCPVTRVPTFCGNGRLDKNEECDPPGTPCKLFNQVAVCGENCKCPVKARCGDGKKDPGENCDPPGSKCFGIHFYGVCNNECGCDEGTKETICGNKIKEKGEDCDPPGSKCFGVHFYGVCSDECWCDESQKSLERCGNRVVEDEEECDPPGSLARQCPPIMLPNGACGMPLCTKDCQCPKGTPCTSGVTEKKDEMTTGPQVTPVPIKPKSCEELCAERGKSTAQPDHTSYIQSFLQQHSCVSGANIRMAGALTITGPGINCKCYSSDKPEITINTQKPVCNTPCGNVPCGESASCPCPDRANCVLTASCSWKGWRFEGQRAIPIVGGEAKQQ